MSRTLTALVVGIVLAGPAHAAPIVQVKARSSVQLDPVRRVPGGIEVRGRLIDRSVRGPILWASLTVRLDDRIVNSVTDEDGEFAQHFPIIEGAHSVTVSYAGDRTYAGSTASIEGFDVNKEPVTLTVKTQREIATGGGELPVIVRAKSLHGPVAITATVLFGDAGAQMLDPVGTVSTNDSGRGEIALPDAKLGKPGRKRLTVRFAGNEAYDVASAHAEIIVTTGTAIELSVSDTEVRYEDSVSSKGRLVDSTGAAIAGAPVALIARGKHVADALTGPDGRFVLSVDAAELGAGKIGLQAKFESPERWRKSSRSSPITVTIFEPQPVPMRYTVAAFAATAFAVLAFVGLRTRPWVGLLARLRPDATDSAGRRSGSGGVANLQEIRTGLVQARPSLVSTLRRPNDFGFSGTVCDAVTGKSVASAELVLVAQNQSQHQAVAGAGGKFELGPLEGGHWTVVVSCGTYCTERFEVTLPHRGELRGARVELMPVRERIFRIYREAALPLLPDPAKWGIWTPRQLFDYVREQRPAEALADLTDFVEDKYFSQRTPTEDILDEARNRAGAATAETQQAMV
jgi:hypothetical protein